jgi:hypothetical protein
MPLRLALTAACLLAAAAAARATPAPDGVFCAHDGGARILAVAPAPDGALRFGLSVWTPQGRNLSVFGVAQAAGQGWRYEDGAACRLGFIALPAGGLTIAADPGADCADHGPPGTGLGTIRFPHALYEGRVTDQLRDAEAFQHAGSCAGGH